MFGSSLGNPSDTPYTVNELAEVVGRAMGATPKLQHLPPRNESVHAYSDHEKARRIFGHTRPVELVDGRVLETGSPQAIRESPRVREAYLGEEE